MLEQTKKARSADGEKVYESEHTKWTMHAANYYSRSKNFEKAAEYLEEIYSRFPEVPSTHSHAVFLNNYSNILFDLKNHEKCAAVIEKFAHFLEHHELVRKLTKFRLLVCYALLRQPEKIRPLLPQQYSALDNEEYYFYRSMVAVVFYLEHEFRHAVREAGNLLESMKNRNADENILLIWKTCLRYFEILLHHSHEKKKLDAQLKKLQAQVSDYNPFVNGMITYNSIWNWLSADIEKRV